MVNRQKRQTRQTDKPTNKSTKPINNAMAICLGLFIALVGSLGLSGPSSAQDSMLGVENKACPAGCEPSMQACPAGCQPVVKKTPRKRVQSVRVQPQAVRYDSCWVGQYGSNMRVQGFVRDAPRYYEVQPGDTYYSISQRFLLNPRLWAEAWIFPGGLTGAIEGELLPGSWLELMRPHAIVGNDNYVGDACASVYGDVKFRILPQGEAGLAMRNHNFLQIRRAPNEAKAIPVAWSKGIREEHVLPVNAVYPHIAKATVVPYSDIANAPIIAGFVDSRMVGSRGTDVYVRGHIDENIREWYVYRPAEEVVDPQSLRSLGYVARLQGIVRPTKRARDAYSFEVISGIQELERGSRLVPVNKATNYQDYDYKKPNANIYARVAGIYDGSSLSSQYRTVVINKGARNGVERGDVFTLLKTNEVSYTNEFPMNNLAMTGYGRIYVYNVTPTAAFALVIEGEGEVTLYDYVRPYFN